MTNAIAPTPQQRDFMLRMATSAAHKGATAEEMLQRLGEILTPIVNSEAARHGDVAKAGFKAAKGIAKSAKSIMGAVSAYLSADDIRAGHAGRFDTRSLGCWIAIAEKAGVAHVPALPVLTIPELLIELVQNPDEVEQAPRKPGVLFGMLNRIAGGALDQIFGPLDRIPVEHKRELHAIALAMLQQAGERIPHGHMVRHDHMGPATLKAWAGIGWEPWNGDDGVRYQEGDRQVTLGPGWISLGNNRFVDVTDGRTSQAVATAFVDEHVFYARPWMRPARRYGGIDIHRPADWPEEMRRGSWPAEWRVFIRDTKAVAVASYYPWAEIPGDATDQAMAEQALMLAQTMADAAQVAGLEPHEPMLDQLRRRSPEARMMLPAGRVNATLDFIETENGLMFLEGAPVYAPGGYGAHPCAFAGTRWPEGFAFRLAEGIDIANQRSWGEEALRRPA